MSVSCLLICLWLYIHSSDAAIKDYYWRDYSFGEMPSDAVEIANDGKYIGQALVTKAIIPVTIYPHLGMAIGAGFERITIRQNIKILCTSDLNGLYWDLVDFNNPIDGQSKNAIIGGFHMEGLNYYIGKAYLDGEWRVGKVIPMESQWKGLKIWDSDGKTAAISKFYLLKYNNMNSNDNVPACGHKLNETFIYLFCSVFSSYLIFFCK